MWFYMADGWKYNSCNLDKGVKGRPFDLLCLEQHVYNTYF